MATKKPHKGSADKEGRDISFEFKPGQSGIGGFSFQMDKNTSGFFKNIDVIVTKYAGSDDEKALGLHDIIGQMNVAIKKRTGATGKAFADQREADAFQAEYVGKITEAKLLNGERAKALIQEVITEILLAQTPPPPPPKRKLER